MLHILQLIGCSVSGLSTHQCADGCPSLICFGHPRDDVLTSGYMYSGKLQPYLHSESDVYMMLMDALLIHE
ncbi:hypothetical protein PVAP13_1NG548201 [Panicum virgatum]|uniref:Uncharacterized protein n=1 Tax=Panicum virgatum TaxID=38727 RepID=A0A8T0X0U7_PANVG|nr:hypothetical protein PVAP13_1NG548201 [Panicum virgatum]